MYFIHVPKIEIIVNHTEFGYTYNLYLDGEYDGTFNSNSELQVRIGFMLNHLVNEVIGNV